MLPCFLSSPHSGGGGGACHDYGLEFLICVHDHLLLVSEKKKKEALPLSLFAIVPLENHGFTRNYPEY